MKEGERPIAGMSKNEWIEGQKQGWIRTKTKGRDCNADKLEGISEEKRVGGRVVVDRRVWPDGETGAKREPSQAAKRRIVLFPRLSFRVEHIVNKDRTLEPRPSKGSQAPGP
ncbi:predicted protein [Histoplasma capsulatum G186AR]|uniref:Uncharacterized protein n=1 Tax=Ajellomyces capsulatus (strain G186AR / H82 / ATCC MYA-2454 / RMSCC 2432) TaxID=447093 RepID=C0NSE2_AJECG|nr:uncharacterized protein HCBG_06072 [Histoplasma capsulatum G186AR]EEH05807.1 predicted protein [Histoplasma capsulatum G186AR]